MKYLFLFVLIVYSCSDEKVKLIQASSERDEKKQQMIILNGKPILQHDDTKKEVSGIVYQCTMISALDYLKRKGEKPDKIDLVQLEKETVFIYEISIQNQTKKIMDSPRIEMNDDDLMKYLAGTVSNDFEVEQDGKTYISNGALYEGTVGNGNTLRIYFFLKGLDLNRKMMIRYYDRIFGSGFIKITKNASNNLSV
jgi:hypothetical protein